MLDEKTAREISGLCVERIDWTVVGAKGGAVTVFTGRGRYHASYGAEGDPVKETGGSGEPGRRMPVRAGRHRIPRPSGNLHGKRA